MMTFALLRDSSDLHIYKDLYGENKKLCSNFALLQRSKVGLATRPETPITFTPGGRQFFAPIKNHFLEFTSLKSYSKSLSLVSQMNNNEY